MTNLSSLSPSTVSRPLWAIRAAKQPDAHPLFMERNLVALEDQGLGDLTMLGGDREAFYAAYRRVQPTSHRTSIAGIAGKFYRFALEMQKGDLVLYPATREKLIYVGVLIGLYQYDLSTSFKYPHQRSVRWVGSILNSSLSHGAKLELGAARMLFQLKRHDVEILGLVSTISSECTLNIRTSETERA